MARDPFVEYAPVESLARFYWIKESYIYVLANRHGWRRIKVGRQVRYNVWDADKQLRPGRTRRMRRSRGVLDI